MDLFVCITCFSLVLFLNEDYKKYVHWVKELELSISLCFSE